MVVQHNIQGRNCYERMGKGILNNRVVTLYLQKLFTCSKQNFLTHILNIACSYIQAIQGYNNQ